MTLFTQSQSRRTGYLRRARLALVCVSVVANALFGAAIYTFPLISPSLMACLKLTQPQITTIALAGMMGQYPFAVIVGKVIDRYGPWACSIIASCLFFLGFGLSAMEIAKTPDDITLPSASSFHRLTLYFFIAGLGSSFSWFSSLFAASKNFPTLSGMAAGISTACFSLSPMFISILASRFFTHPQDGLDVTHFLQFLSFTCGAVHLFGGFTLHVIPASEDVPSALEDAEGLVHVDERTALLQGTSDHTTCDTPDSPVKDVSVIALFKDSYFWALVFVTFVILGSCETVMSNIGTIVLSLSVDSSSTVATPSTDAATAMQVRLTSAANTLSRLFIGPVADFVSPVASHLPPGAQIIQRKYHISRVALLFFPLLVLVVSYSWMVVGVRSQVDLWALSVGSGAAYGLTFTILPSIVSAAWGIENVGRNFGIMNYSPFFGTPVFSYLYAFNAASHSPSDGTACKGIVCWQSTFSWNAAATGSALGVAVYLWRAWRDRM